MPIFVVTTVDQTGSYVTTEVEAEHYFTDDEWVTFWVANRLDLPAPVTRFEHAAIVQIEEK